MTIVPKKKICSGCSLPKILWKSNPPTCKECSGRERQAKANGEASIARKPIKTKSKASVNGKPVHTALYMAAFGYGNADFIPSELSGQKAVDTHHIAARSLGGTKTEDRIENLMGLTREEHLEYGDKKQYMAFLYRKHRDFMSDNGVKFNREWIEGEIERWKVEENE